jgi:Spy/CpxP family protein refolding chaperone
MSIGMPRRTFLLAAGVAALTGLSLAGHLVAHETGGGPDGDGWAPRPYRRAVRMLALTPDQQTKIRGILKNHADEILAQRRAGVASRRALRAAQRSQPLDENAIRNSARALGEVRADGAVLHARIRSEIWPLLTPEQQDRAKTLRAKREGREERLENWLRDGS